MGSHGRAGTASSLTNYHSNIRDAIKLSLDSAAGVLRSAVYNILVRDARWDYTSRSAAWRSSRKHARAKTLVSDSDYSIDTGSFPDGW